jgi:ABC-2 type transport system permease protein
MNATSWPLQGFWPFFWKELSEWWRSRAALATLGVLAALGVLGTMSTRIDAWAGGIPTPVELDPTYNVIGAKFDQWIIFGSIFASIGMVINERERGTLAWTLSKPVSRGAVLLAKWGAGTVALALFGLAIPLVVAAGVADLAYGGLPEPGTVAVLGLWLVSLPAFVLALNLALATRIRSQAAIGAIAFAIVLAPYALNSFLPLLAELWPTSMASVATMVAAGDAPNIPTITSWAATLILIGSAGLLIFSREDL